MANWKKVIVSGSSAELAALRVDNLSSGVVTGASGNLTTTAINGTGNILATTGATGVSISGSFNGTLIGNASTATSASFADLADIANLAYLANNAGFATNAENATYAGLAVSASHAEFADNATSASYAAIAPYSGLIGIPTGIVSGSSQVNITGTTGYTTFSQSLATTDANQSLKLSSIEVSTGSLNSFTSSINTTIKNQLNANTVISGSSQVLIGSGVWSGSAQLPSGVVSGSSQLNNTSISGLTLTNVSATGSFSGDGSNLTGIATVLSVSGSTGNGTVNLKSQSLTIQGTANEIETSVSGQTVTVGLPDNVTLAGNLLVQGNTTLQGNLTVNGTTTTIDTQNLYIEDKFALFASGSTTATDGGFIIQSNTNGTGYAFGYDASADRWALEDGLAGDATAFSGTPTAYMASVQYGLASAQPANPSYGGSAAGYGNIWVSTDTSDIWIYA